LIDDRITLKRFHAAALDAALVSFDLFDTLLTRAVWRPDDLFALIARRLPPAQGAWFMAQRGAAEAAARHAAGASEITLADIYAVLRNGLAPPDAMLLDLDAVMALEIALEIDGVAADAAVQAVFAALVAADRRVVLVSDMYLPRHTIEAMLQRAGIVGHERLYLSSETGRTKASGAVWADIRADFGLALEPLITHLGDHPASDGRVAARHGITPFLLSVPEQRVPDRRFPPSRHPLGDMCHALLRRAIQGPVNGPVNGPVSGTVSGLHDADPYFLTLAYLVVAPAAIGMAGWIAAMSREEGRRVHFLARDGLVFQTAYEAAWRTADEPASSYIWSSRRCLNISAIDRLGETDLDFLCSGVTDLPVAAYLRRIGLDTDDPAIARCIAHIVPDPTMIVGPAERDRLRAAFTALAGPIEAQAAIERSALLDHLDRVGLFASPALVVDLGWHGSLQRSLLRLRDLAGATTDIAGAYLGTTAAQPRTIDARGWWFTAGDPHEVVTATIGRSYEVIELLFSAPESGISHVVMTDGAPAPVRLIDPAEQPRLALAALFHRVVAEVATAMRPHLVAADVAVLRTMALDHLSRLLGAPTPIDARKFAAITHAEGFGAAAYRPIIAASPGLLRPNQLHRAHREAFWRQGFRAQLDPVTRLAVRAMGRLRG
jgi:hypothetical protein